MKQNKQAGIERPFKIFEFKRLIEQMAKEQQLPYIDQLEYFINADYSKPEKEQPVLDDWDIQFHSDTYWGSNEGIYSRIYIKRYEFDSEGHNGKWVEYEFGTMKTLGEGDADFINMHTLAARIILMAEHYMRDHDKDFRWTGYDVNYTTPEGEKIGWICSCKKNALQKAYELQKQGFTVTMINNATRQQEPIL